MSLRDFHILFVTASILCSIGFGWWAVNQYAAQPGWNYLTTALASFFIAGGLVIYEVLFIKKIKG
ncbi:MAG: hypothetical protein HZA28_06015 [Candidatus Omnitrophica bacterium]|nr:hypothetical protein [Candidatus Omnitrophota bacterium]